MTRRSVGPGAQGRVRAQHQVMAPGAPDRRGAGAGHRAAHPCGADRNGELLPGLDHFVRSAASSSRSPTTSTAPRPPYAIDGRRPAARHPAPTRAEQTPPVASADMARRSEADAPEAGDLPLADLKILDATAWRAGPERDAAPGRTGRGRGPRRVDPGHRRHAPGGGVAVRHTRRMVGAQLLLPEHQHQQAPASRSISARRRA